MKKRLLFPFFSTSEIDSYNIDAEYAILHQKALQKGYFIDLDLDTLRYSRIKNHALNTTKGVASLKFAMEQCKTKNIVLQAGGHVGMWPYVLSRYFKLVYTFEPLQEMFYFLNLNCTSKNIIKFQASLNNESTMLNSLKLKAPLEFLQTERFTEEQKYMSIKIDDLNLIECNAILLDIEGWEYFALQGAKDTIKRCKPVILAEIDKECNQGYALRKKHIDELMQECNYKLINVIARDAIYVPR